MIWWIVLWVATVIAVFWLGLRFGAQFYRGLLTREQALHREEIKMRKEIELARDDAWMTITKIKGAAAEAKLDIKKVFPFLTLICALGLGLLDGRAHCGKPRASGHLPGLTFPG